jgi:hypothetical protein
MKECFEIEKEWEKDILGGIGQILGISFGQNILRALQRNNRAIYFDKKKGESVSKAIEFILGDTV